MVQDISLAMQLTERVIMRDLLEKYGSEPGPGKVYHAYASGEYAGLQLSEV